MKTSRTYGLFCGLLGVWLLISTLWGCAHHDPKNSYEKLLETQMERDKAIARTEKVSPEKLPKMTDADHERSGDAHFQQGKLGRAYVQYTKALHLNPKNTRVRYKMGLLFLTKGLNEEAIKELIKANNWGPIEIQENIEAEFADIAAGVFGDYLAIAEDYDYPVKPEKGHTYMAAIDLAQVEDWTVLYIADLTVKPAKIVYKWRVQKLDYTLVANEMVDRVREYNGAKGFSDATNEKTFFNLIRKRITAGPIVFSPKTKPQMVQNLANMIQDKKFIYSKYDEDLRNELSVYRGQRMETGYVKYAAPQGYHDDCVSALMMLMWGARSRMGGEVPIPYQAEAYDPMKDQQKHMDAVNRFYEEQFKGG